ncbi:hypothetical protein PZB74_19610 [Porifericola rhodea]|uniref:hypothetical protein n=1 Tax=Porifericola rhodea TaxID=930972 RepID=UPI002665E1F1|nr:hypothetical protein [Porifericola rhodea]WKN31161.1 hypothetical protein PZB74_19610 [Porifericola rhodea]
MKKTIIFTFSFILLLMGLPQAVLAQENETQEKDSSLSIAHLLKQGEVELHARSFMMSTINHSDLKDYYAWAIGAGIGYQSPLYKNLQFGLSGFFIYNMAYGHNAKQDENSSSGNRYEKMLFNALAPHEKEDLDRLEELYIRYQSDWLKITLGRQKLESPFVNGQYNRMRPNIFSGLSTELKLNAVQVHNTWVKGITPRGTIEWFSIENSFGVYGMGRQTNGLKAEYHAHIKSAGLWLSGLEWKHKKAGKLQVWNYYTDRVFNFSFAQWDYQNKALQLGLQSFYERAIQEGGNHDQALSYMQRGEQTAGLGTRIAYSKPNTEVSINYLGISSKGRYLFPREWGREQFYASLPRERFEGNGGVQTFSIKAKRSFNQQHTKIVLGLGSVNLPAPENTQLNKYGLPSYYHLAAELKHQLHRAWKGTSATLLVVNKIDKNEETSAMYKTNHVDMWNLNFIIDYKF